MHRQLHTLMELRIAICCHGNKFGSHGYFEGALGRRGKGTIDTLGRRLRAESALLPLPQLLPLPMPLPGLPRGVSQAEKTSDAPLLRSTPSRRARSAQCRGTNPGAC